MKRLILRGLDECEDHAARGGENTLCASRHTLPGQKI